MPSFCPRETTSHHCKSSHNDKPARRKRKRRKHDTMSILFDFEVWQHTLIMWIVGVIIIEVYFFYKSVHILDHAAARRHLFGHSNEDLQREPNNSEQAKQRPPIPRQPPPSKTSLLPKRVIAVFGPESSGTTFLSTTLGVAVGAFTKDGGWFHTPSWAFNHTVKGAPPQTNRDLRRVHSQYNPTGIWDYEEEVQRRVMTIDGEWEIQHLSLPWGWECEEDKVINIVEALVPEECFRYEKDPYLHPKSAEKLWFSTNGRDLDSSTLINEDRNITSEEQRLLTMCRDEVKISQKNDDKWTCGAKCGTGKYNGCALYPERFSVNITSHIEWYLNRGVDIKVVLSIRDRTISSRGKLKGHCHLADVGKKEDKVALSLMSEAIEKYGNSEHLITVSYEGMMNMQEVYLYDLYHRLGINSTYTTTFFDGNRKYLVPIDGRKLLNKYPLIPPKPESYVAPQPKTSLLPKRVIAVFGPESSGTKFLATALAVAVGAFPREGQWSHVPLPSQTEQWVHHQYNYRRAMSPDGEWEVQHISLPYGGGCKAEDNNGVKHNIVDALVPSECFRYESDPDLGPESAEVWDNMDAGVKNMPRKLRKLEVNDVSDEVALDAALLKQCRNEVHITKSSSSWTCGAICGDGQYDGLALYPKRYFVNFTSHIEWYRDRGVEITAIISMRDHSISREGKVRDHCFVPTIAVEEDELALRLMKEAMTKYGNKRSINGRPTIISTSYEGMMQFKKVYLFDLYRQLGIESSYMPIFKDGNAKYVRDEKEYLQFLPKPKKHKRSYLAKKIITVVGPESSGTTFLASALGLAVDIFEVDGINRQAMSSNEKWEIQHLSLPWGWRCEENQTTNIVESLVPAECFRYERDPAIESRLATQVFLNRDANAQRQPPPKKASATHQQEEDQIRAKCRDQVKISQKKGPWTCGAKCGEDEYDGFALYPQRFSVNITSHIEWWLARGVDIKVIISLRDRHISSKGKLKTHCHLVDAGRKEDEVALSLMSEAIEKYRGTGRVITVSYEGLMRMQETYLFSLYKELGINSTYHPVFVDGNKKYTTDANAMLNAANIGKAVSDEQLQKPKIKPPPKPRENHPPPPRESLLPKKLITVIGGTTFLSTTLAIAAGAFPSEGRWVERGPQELVFESSMGKSATSSNGDWQVQQLNHLPQGQKCTGDVADLVLDTIGALVPEECVRLDASSLITSKDISECQKELHITEGYVLYPPRFFVNITSHIEWYLSHDVDITVVFVMRDQSISMKEKLRNDCRLLGLATKEEEVSLAIIKEAYAKYGKHGSLLKSGKERAVVLSYEGLLELKDVYLFDLYHKLGINSTYTPKYYEDGNAKYVADPKIKTAFRKENERHHKKAERKDFMPK